MFAGLVFALVIGNMPLSEFAAALSGDAVIDPPALFIYAEADFDRMVQMTLDDPGALVVDVPGVGEVLARRDHIVSKHGQAVFDAILKGPNDKRDCEGKTYLYHKTGESDHYNMAVIKDGVWVTAYEVVKGLLEYYWSRDGCPPPLNFGHDNMSSAW